MFSRLTARSYLQPRYFVSPAALPAGFSLPAWSQSFEWESDAWDGWRDTISPVEETVRTGRGDCDDYATVAASWALKEGRDDVRLGFCFDLPEASHTALLTRKRIRLGLDIEPPGFSHMVAFTDDHIYSSGTIHEASFQEWLEGTQYDQGITRRVRGDAYAPSRS